MEHRRPMRSTSLLAALLTLSILSCSPGAPPPVHALTLQLTGAGQGTVASSPDGIAQCARASGTCTSNFEGGVSVTLTATPSAGDFFAGWSGGGCAGVASCTVTVTEATTVKATFLPVYFYSGRQLGPTTPNPNPTQNIWMVHGDGSGAKPLTENGTAYASYGGFPSPDGEKVVYISTRSVTAPYADQNLRRNVWTSDAEGANAVPLTQFLSTDAQFARWTPDGRIVYSAAASAAHADASNANNFFIVRADGTDRVALTSHSASAAVQPTRFTLDAEHFYFSSNRGITEETKNTPVAEFNIWKVKLDGTGATPLTNSVAVYSYGPSLSPDGQTLSYATNHALDPSVDAAIGVTNIWLMDVNGGNKRPLTQSTVVYAYSPFYWSADGRKIVFTSNKNPDGTDTVSAARNIWTVDVATGQMSVVAPVTEGAMSSLFPNFLPDNRILFQSFRNPDLTMNNALSDCNLFVVNSDGSGLDAITTDITGAYNNLAFNDD